MLALPEVFRHFQAPGRAHGNACNAEEHQQPRHVFSVGQVAFTAAVSPNTDMGASGDEADSAISSPPPSSVSARRPGPSRREAVTSVDGSATLGFGSPWRVPGPPAICRMGCGRAAFGQGRFHPQAFCCVHCTHTGGTKHSEHCDRANGVGPMTTLRDTSAHEDVADDLLSSTKRSAESLMDRQLATRSSGAWNALRRRQYSLRARHRLAPHRRIALPTSILPSTQLINVP